jgi:hypothetical protein
MTARRLSLARAALVVAGSLAVALAGCGQRSTSRRPSLGELPLVRGARIVANVQQCDRGASGFCAIELVVVDRRYHSSDALVTGEHHRLRKQGWAAAGGDTGDERAAESPGRRLRVTYATAYGELKGIDLKWIQRPRTITMALSRTMFDRDPAMSLLLETGPS